MAIGSAPEIGVKFSTGKKTAQEVRDGIAHLTTYYAKAADGDIVHYPPRYPNGVMPVDWYAEQSNPDMKHEYVGSGERCRVCNFTVNHVLHVDWYDVQIGAFDESTDTTNV